MGLTYPSNKICPRCGTGGYVWYLDDSEYVAKCTKCGHYFRREDFPLCVLDEAPKPMTNSDCFRAMTDEELAVICEDGCPPQKHECPPIKREELGLRSVCQKCWTDWLKSPAEGQVRETVAERRDNLRLMWIAEDNWLKREPPIWKFWAWRRWKRERPVWDAVSE